MGTTCFPSVCAIPVSYMTLGFLPVKSTMTTCARKNKVEDILDDDAFFPDIVDPQAAEACSLARPTDRLVRRCELRAEGHHDDRKIWFQ